MERVSLTFEPNLRVQTPGCGHQYHVTSTIVRLDTLLSDSSNALEFRCSQVGLRSVPGSSVKGAIHLYVRLAVLYRQLYQQQR